MLIVLKGQSQQSFQSIDSLTFSSTETNLILEKKWEEIESYAELGDTNNLKPLLEEYQKLSHHYGFRFEHQFDKERLHFSYHQIFDELFILEDKSGKLEIEDVLQSQNQEKFVPNTSSSSIQRDILEIIPRPTVYNVESVYWVKLNAKNLSEEEQEAWFMVGWNERSWEEIDIFEDDGINIKKVGKSGLRIPESAKMAKDWRSLVQIKVAAKSESTFYFRLKGIFHSNYPDLISFYHFDEQAYWSKKSFALFEDGIFLGMTFLLLLLVFILYYYDKQKDTLLFLVHLSGIWLHDFANTEHIGASNFYSELFPGALEQGRNLANIGFLMMMCGFDLFSIVFLNAKKYAPRMRKWILWILYTKAALFIFIKLFDIFLYRYFDYPYSFTEVLFYVLMVPVFLTPLVILGLGFVTLKNKNPIAKIFIIAFLPIVLVSLISFFGEIFLNNFFSSNQLHVASRIGHLANYILFAVAIAYKRQMERNQIMEKRLELGKQLYKEQEEAQKLKDLDSFKTRLYTNLTHEFRTPLTVILGMAKQLVSVPKNELANLAEVIERNGRNLLELINQLLDLSKLENKSFQLNLQHGNVVPFFRYITESFQSYANSQNLSLQFYTTIEQLYMDFDPKRSTQMLSNLISNALKFTPSGGKISVKLNKENDKLLIQVSDTGIGIPSEELPHVFDRFFQVDNSSTRKGEGTGIGLAHTKELIKLMGGNIVVKSEVGKGTTFLIHLDIRQNIEQSSVELLIEKEESSNSIFEANVPIPPTTLHNLSGSGNKDNLPQLLIIEDNPDVVFYLQSCLENQYRLDIAYNGRIGIEKALETIPDIIISDVMMPEKNGYEVCDSLKNDEKTSHIPIILLTAKADDSSKITGLKRGADAYLTKPFDKEELLIRLEQMIEQKKRILAHFSNQQSVDLADESIVLEDAFIKKVRQIVEENFEDERFALPLLCKKVGMSRSQLYRKMKALTDISPSDFIRNFRLQEAKKLLEQGELNVSEVTYQVGFKDISHFSRIFQETFGYLPSEVKK